MRQSLRVVARFLLGYVLPTSLVGLGMIVGQVFLGLGQMQTVPGVDQAPAAHTTRVERMIDAGSCWTDNGQHPFAHHAWYLNTETGHYRYGTAARAYDIAFHGADAGTTEVAAFCE
mgnify:CR=1 FL=1